MKNVLSFLALSALLIGSVLLGLHRQENIHRSLRAPIEKPKQSEVTRELEGHETDDIRFEGKARAAEEYQEAATQARDAARKYAAENGILVEDGHLIEMDQIMKVKLQPRIKAEVKKQMNQNRLLAQYYRLKSESP